MKLKTVVTKSCEFTIAELIAELQRAGVNIPDRARAEIKTSASFDVSIVLTWDEHKHESGT